MKKGKIIAISGQMVSIGVDGTIEEVRLSDHNFNPAIGDEVEIFRSETKVIVSKIEKAEPNTGRPGGININVNQTNGFAGATVNPNGRVVNKWSYVLLAFFIGGIGGHKFYAGRVVAGILYLLFCWTFIPTIIAFIEMIIAICKTADSNGNIVV